MSNLKSIIFLISAIVLLAAANVVLHRRDMDRFASARVHLLASSDDVREIVLRRHGEAGARLVRQSTWKLVEPFRASADGQVVMRLLDALSTQPIGDTISDSELKQLGRTRADLQLTDPLVTVSVRTAADATTVNFGGPTPTGDGVFAAVSGVDSIFTVPTDVLLAVDLPTESFRRRTLFLFGTESVMAFDVKSGSGRPLSFSRDGEGWRKPDGRRPSAKKIKAFLDDLTSAVAGSFVWPTGASNETIRISADKMAGYGLDPDSAVTVTLKCNDGADRQIAFGKNADDASVYALVQNGSAVVTVPLVLKEAATQDAEVFSDLRLFSVEESAVTAFTLTDGDVSYAFARTAEETWRLEAPVVAAADSEMVGMVLRRILALSSADTVKKGVLVSISTNEHPVSVSRDRVLGGGSFEDFRSKDILQIDTAQVRRIVRTAGGADARPTSVLYVRDHRIWRVESENGGGTVDERGISRVLSAVNPLRAVRIVKLKVNASDLDDFGLDKPYLTIAIDQDAESAFRKNILLGAKAASGGRYATVGSSDAVFVVSEEVVRLLSSPITKGEQ